MLARLFNSETFTAWAKKEIAEFIFSTILIFVILITISQTNIDIKNLITKKQNEVDFSYFNNLCFMAAEALTENIYYYSIISSYNYNYNLGINIKDFIDFPFNVGYNKVSSMYPGYGSNFLLNQLYFGVDSAFNVLFSLTATKIVYDYLVFCIYSFIFPLAIFLRFFPFTRKAGGYLLGFCLAILFVFPFAFNLASILGNATIQKAKADYPFLDINNKNNLVFGYKPQVKKVISDAGEIALNTFYILTPSNIAIYIALLINMTSGGLIPTGTIYGGTSLFPTGNPLAGILELILKLLAKSIPIILSNDLATSEYSVDQILEHIYKPTVDFLLPFFVFFILLALVELIFALAFTIILGRAFAHFLGQEGQLYSLSRLI